MQRHLGWLARNKLFRLSFRNQLQSGSRSIPLLEKLTQVFTDVGSILFFHSTVYESYLKAVSIQDTRRNFRSALKMILFTIWCAMYDITFHEGELYSSVITMLFTSLVFIIFLYLYTYNQYSHAWYSQASYVLLTAVFLITVYHSSKVIFDWGCVLPYLKLLICLCIILPVSLELTISLVIVFSFSFITVVDHQRMFTTCDFDNATTSNTVPILGSIHKASTADTCRALAKAGLCIQIQLITCTVLCVAGMHLKFWNTLRRRAAFIYIGQAVHLQKRNRKAAMLEENLLRVLMPLSVYHKYIGRDEMRTSYGKRYYHMQDLTRISFMAIEMGNFRDLAETQNLSRTIEILTDMLDFFDKKADEYNCERVNASANDFLYVCGMIRVKTNHAKSCVDFALDLTRVNEQLTLEGNKLVILKIGIHSGSATLMVWGSRQMCCDILSPDVNTTYLIKDSCPPGFVAISSTTYTRVHVHYITDEAEKLQIKTEKLVDGERTMDTSWLQTYYVRHPPGNDHTMTLSTSTRSELGLFGRCVHLIAQIRISRNTLPSLILPDLNDEPAQMTNTIINKRHSVFSLSKTDNRRYSQLPHAYSGSIWNMDRSKATQQEEPEKPYHLDADVLRLVTELRSDPRRQITLMQYLPAGQFTNIFRNRELEWHYVNHVKDSSCPIYVDSLKLAPALDVLVLLAICIIMVYCSASFTESLKSRNQFRFIYIMELLSACLIALGVVWTSTRYARSIRKQEMRPFFDILAKPGVQQMFLCLLALYPTIQTFLFVKMCVTVKMDVNDIRNATACLHFIAMLSQLVVTTSPLWLSVFRLVINSIVLIVAHEHILYPAIFNTNDFIEPRQALNFAELFANSMLSEVFITALIIWIMIRLNNRNCRLNFMSMRELQVCREESNLFQSRIKKVLGHLLPKCVVQRLIESQLTCTIPEALNQDNRDRQNVGVAIIRFSNLFSTQWASGREHWESALKVMNLFICVLDEILSNNRFNGLERVRFVHDQLIMISGLEPTNGVWDDIADFHLSELLDFCLQSVKRVKFINRQFLPRRRSLSLNIGYTQGTVSTGIIGLQKPVFCAWGAPIRLAEAVARSGPIDEVQTTVDCIKNLSASYEAIFANVIAVEDLGLVETYIVRSKRY